MTQATTSTVPDSAALAVAGDRPFAGSGGLAPPLPTLRVNSLLLLVALWLAATQNQLLWREVLKSLVTPRGWQVAGVLAAVGLTLFSAQVLTGALFSSRRLLRPALIALVTVAAGCSYFMDRFHVVIDQTMLVNALQTDRHEAAELLGLPLLLHMGLYALLPALFIARVPLRRSGWLRESLGRLGLVAALLALTAACVFGQYRSISSWARNNADMRMYPNPSFPIYSAYKYARHQWRNPRGKGLLAIGTDAVREAPVAGRRPQVVVLVIGETARAANFQLDGYPRATNPELSAIDGLLNFSDVWSCGTSTAVSVPCMFFSGGHKAFSKSAAGDQENLLDLVQRTGVEVLWRNNNSGCKGVCTRVQTENLSDATDALLCGADGCYDEILLRQLDQRLQRGQDQLIVLHSKGSHGPAYFRRVPEAYRRFRPDCENDDLQQCSAEQIVNAYDNSIVYTDHVLAQLIRMLKQREDQVDSTMLYLSDHGESLGEGGLYLHGMPYGLAPDTQKQVPMMAWFSAGTLQSQGLAQDCLQSQRALHHSHDDLFSTMLGLLSIRTQLYQRQHDLFAECRKSAALASGGLAAPRALSAGG